jgi:diguanylate cyclase (GGDEF)-like protein/PAS domain S-box-containing protein
MSQPPPVQRHPLAIPVPPLSQRALFGGVAAFMLLLLMAALLSIVHLRQEALQREAATTQKLAQSIELSVEGLIGAIDLGLRVSADEIRRQHATGQPDAPAITRFLTRQTEHLNQVAHLHATNARGDVRYGPDSALPAAYLGDRADFIRLRDDPNAGLRLLQPSIGQAAQKTAWSFMRRINQADGSFAGVVYAAIEPDQLNRLLEKMALDPASIALRDADLGLIARLPHINLPLGDRNLSTPWTQALQRNPQEGSYTSDASSLDPIVRSYTYHRSAKYGFYVNVGTPLALTLAQWRQQAWLIVGLTSALALALLGFAVLLRRAWQRQLHVMTVLQANQQALHETQEIAGLGHYAYDLRTDRWSSSDILDGIFGVDSDYPRDAKHWLALVVPDSRTDMQAHLNATIHQDQPFDHEYRIIRPHDGQERWVHVRGKLKRDSAGLPQTLSGSLQDITERKRTEQQQHIAAIAFESQEGMFITDAAKVIIRINQAFTDITGYTPAEAVGQKPSLLSSGRHDDAFYAAMMADVKHNGSWQGEIWNRRKNGEHYPEWLTITQVNNHAGDTTHYVATLIDITVRKTAENEIRNLAFYDPLTRLPNRRLMQDRLQHALSSSVRHQRHGAMMLLDLDNFKTLNDTLGHAMGDQLLQEVAVRLSASIREGDTVARLGGDEFVVILEDLDQAGLAALQAESVAHKILTQLSAPYPLNVAPLGSPAQMRNHHCSASIGIALFREHPVSVEELVSRADTAMYQAKAAGRNTLRFFDPEMQAVVTARAALEADLREALQSRQFILHYQPQLTYQGQVTGVEALVRWQHPQRGLVSPAAFIAVAEETGLILPLGLWVLETACAQLARWASQPGLTHLTLAVNVSARQLHQTQFVEQVLAVLARHAIQPQHLKLELTESLLVDDVKDTIAKMMALKAHGVGFSLDDFGTGYSSLAYLKRLPLDQLKIDQSFVRDILTDPNDAAIAQMVIALGQSLGLTVIAEGVETLAQRDHLASLGCHDYQGYLYSQPLPVEALERFIKAPVAVTV